ncbi:cell division-associated protein-like protein [Plenodomus tracheiphilus IPT5]|uniref:separase n=1 Tax=Plenodomus tracheiphilus IPT5 TaxID=1408161 RepID=A0A6A7BPY4_9PLEO|nr:cell division-associated protein-like protein [Plenodomus tracheiphilus IPT5]
MATKDAPTHARIEGVKADLRSTSTCSTTTVAALQELLFRRNDVILEKENVRSKVQATARRRAGTTTAASAEAAKQALVTPPPREKYILATEVANTTLKSLADALKNPLPPSATRPLKGKSPVEDARKPTRPRLGHTKSSSISQKPLKERSVSQASNSPQKRAPRRSSSYSSILVSGPNPGLIATAECARIAFGYLGTPEAAKVLGKDSTDLQYENGVLVLIGKLVALGLDALAIKEMRTLKKRLDTYLRQDSDKPVPYQGAQQSIAGEKESLATLLDFANVESDSPAVTLIATFQIYTLRIIAKLRRPRIVESSLEYLRLTKPSSPANLIGTIASTPSGQTKAARQLESLAQIILALCPSISSADDASPLQPSPDVVLQLQQLAFVIKKKWWTLAKHKGNEQHELLEPFAKCVTAFTRRSQIPATKQYRLVESLYTDLVGKQSTKETSNTGPNAALMKTLCSLAQAAGLPDEALRWLGPSESSTTTSNASAAKQTIRHVRIATVSLEAYLQGETTIDVAKPIVSALDALKGSLGGSSADLESLFMEVNGFRRIATRVLVIKLASQQEGIARDLIEDSTLSIIGASVHFTSRFIGSGLSSEADAKATQRHKARIDLAWKCLKSIVDSVLACCKLPVIEEEQWQDLDLILQECSHLLLRFEDEFGTNNETLAEPSTMIASLAVKLSNAYWAIHIQLRKGRLDRQFFVQAMQRSVSLVRSRSQVKADASLLAMKLERLGEAQEDSGDGEGSRKSLEQCLSSYLGPSTIQTLSDLAAKCPLQTAFSSDGPLSNLVRVLKAHHRSFLKFGILHTDELAFYDNSELPPGARGAILEWQFGLYLRTLSRNRQWDSALDESLVTMTKRLQELYTPKTFPIRYVRLALSLLQLSQTLQHINPPVLEPSIGKLVANSEDEGLSKYEKHLRALWDLKMSMQHPGLPPTSMLKQCFTSWESIVAPASSWSALTEWIDNVEDWLQDIEACVEYLNAKGEEYLALPILHLRIQVLNMQKTPDSSNHINAWCDLALQFLRLGYTGKAGMSFAKAESLVQNQSASTESKLRYHIGYAEYLLAIGNSAKCAASMSSAQAIALADRQFMGLARPTTTLSGRVRFNTILANASYVQSLLAAAGGSYKEAAQHAKQCVTLNRRIWAALESRANAHKSVSETELDSTNGGAFDPLSSMRSEKGVPLVMSVTHDALSGSEFWSLVPMLYRGLMQHSQIYAHQGLLQEAMYVAEQAEKVATATNSPTLMTDNASWRADCWAQSGRHDKAKEILAAFDTASARKCLSIVGYHSAVARVQHCSGNYHEEIASYEMLEQLLDTLAAPSYISTLESFLPSIDTLAEQIGSIALDVQEPPRAKSAAATRGRKAAVKPAPRAASKPATAARAKTNASTLAKNVVKSKRPTPTTTPLKMPNVSEQCHVLCVLKASILDRKVLANILQDDLALAVRLLGEAEELQAALGQEISHMWATFKTRFAQSVQQIAEDITANTLPESTIAFPAIGMNDCRPSEGHVAKRPVIAAAAVTKGAKAKKQAKENFIDTLRDARERLVEAHGLCASNGSNHLFQQISMALGHITVLMSAVSVTELHGSLHPLYAAYMSEIPKCNSLRLVQNSIDAEKISLSRDEYLQWPESVVSDLALSSVSSFQKEYVDIIPESWTAISLALNESHDELYITRFERGISPFVLRLPLARHASREMDEEEFSFEDGKRDFDEIIELSDFSTRTAKDMTSRDARQQWWTEREALDTRLHELLINMENIWLGGFKGVFSPHERQPLLLARFRKSLEGILDQHLPSRRKKSQQKRPVLDARVLELFIGLGDATNEELDLDEALVDLIYFVVDILQFNGERNACDEIDFDTMVIETHEALRAYHSAAHRTSSTSRHTILILDKNLHGFPWESLPCLEQLSVSRLPSLAALRERLLAAKASRTCENAAPGHYIRATSGGTSILNPSGDLAHTTKTIQPRLDDLQGSWDHIANRPPTEEEFESSLRNKELVLYFGHGSGAQYIKSKSVRRLYPGQQDEDNSQPGCATTLLFGCSSVHLTDNGIYEPSGMLASYLTAGAPAVVGMLWDVTDKDCDRFAIRAGELWGLWPEPQEEIIVPKTPAKTPAKKTAKGKGRVAQLAQESEPVKISKKGRKPKATADYEMQVNNDRRGGVGLDEAVRDARQVCVLRYLNGAAAVVYGIPVYLE